MLTDDYSGLFSHLEYLQSQGVHICIKDYVGYLAMNRDFEQRMGKYLAHSKPFCMYIKSDKEMFSQCISMMKRLKTVFSDGSCSSLCGVCFAGVKEYVVPIFHKGNLIGSVHAGIFPTDPRRAEARIRRLCSKSSLLDARKALKLYSQSVNEPAIPSESLISSMHLIANCVSLAVGATLTNNELPEKRSETVLTENMIIADAMDYLHAHFSQPCNVTTLSNYCHCSRSQISHLFKKRTGVSIPIFINRLRVEQAKELLKNSNESVTSIAYAVGFSAPDYFCKVFQHFTGISCSEYKRQNCFVKSGPNYPNS